MKKIVAIFMVLIFLVSFLNIKIVDAEQSYCCGKFAPNGQYCLPTTDRNECDPNQESSPLACAQVAYCREVCCMDNDGQCHSNVPKIQCQDQGGTAVGDSCSISRCEEGWCIIRDQCVGKMSSTKCQREADNVNASYDFDTSIESLQQCIQEYSPNEGCCVTSSGCSRTTGRDCNEEFHPGMLCSNNDLAGVCTCQKEWEKKCGRDGEDVYFLDSCENYENVVGVVYDGFIHDDESDKMGKQGDCNIGGNNPSICGFKSGDYSCVDMNCISGKDFTVDKIEYTDEWEITNKVVTINNKMLGGKTKRVNGESWCYFSNVGAVPSGANSQHPQYSAGSEYYIYSCINGKVIAERCSELRDKYCIDDSKDGVNYAKCVDNKWQDCTTCGEGFTNVCGRDECEGLGDCFWNSAGVHGWGLLINPAGHDTPECWPQYPPAFKHWEGAGQEVCETCGDGMFNRCDDDECWRLGDCSFDEGMSTTGGIIWGAAIGATIIGGAHLLPAIGVKVGAVGEVPGAVWSGTKGFLKWLFGVGGAEGTGTGGATTVVGGGASAGGGASGAGNLPRSVIIRGG